MLAIIARTPVEEIKGSHVVSSLSAEHWNGYMCGMVALQNAAAYSDGVALACLSLSSFLLDESLNLSRL